ncbi:uncharacterized protein DUF2537 [Tamaricihabitans halophyticus]|uniref:Uncharacterized protein DUF2537 n=1 Tax=Tamaricihabitans halophyticus TaxID=1262583 RepID=A0A4R2R203_9PSEU|nr:uncharacterized protein DUF2537 [Tamaricihabitans halophyticus]
MNVELRTRDARAVVVRHDAEPAREVDPAELPLDSGLPEALHEWARVVAAVSRNADTASLAQVGPLVSRRGHQLAARLARSMDRVVDYVDPFTGDIAPVEPSAERAEQGPEPVAQPRVRAVRAESEAGAGITFYGRPPALVDEETVPNVPRPAGTPWATGLTVAGAAALLVALMLLALTVTLADASLLLAIGAAIVLTAGMSPSIWLLRRVLIWRWVAFGACAGLAAGWLGLPFVLG